MKPSEAFKLFDEWNKRDGEYRDRIKNLLEKSGGEDGLSQEEIMELEAMMRID